MHVILWRASSIFLGRLIGKSVFGVYRVANGIIPASEGGISTFNLLERPKMKRLAIALILTAAIAAPEYSDNSFRLPRQPPH